MSEHWLSATRRERTSPPHSRARGRLARCARMTPIDAFDVAPSLAAVPPPKPRRRERHDDELRSSEDGMTREAFMARDDDEDDDEEEEVMLAMHPEWAMRFAATARARAARVDARREEQRALARARTPGALEAERRAEALRARLARVKTRWGGDGDGDGDDDVKVRMYGLDGAGEVAAVEAEMNASFDAWTDARAPEYYPCEPLVRERE